ncbi:unannotated protein [freshwater metagenome]|uniref:Unannotated protein n=1 Tax=freshwater metagenome TaxID=449393 RepID=A0A6J6DXC7_9ZZZZ
MITPCIETLVGSNGFGGWCPSLGQHLKCLLRNGSLTTNAEFNSAIREWLLLDAAHAQVPHKSRNEINVARVDDDNDRHPFSHESTPNGEPSQRSTVANVLTGSRRNLVG